MSYDYSWTKLLDILAERAPEHTAVLRDHRKVLDGLLSVGLKLHFIGKTPLRFDVLVNRLGGPHILTSNMYRTNEISECLVLPPVGSASMAITLIQALELFLEVAVFGNKAIQVQVCSPGRLSPYRTGVLGVAFYLASDTLRWYEKNDFDTTVSYDGTYNRGKRIVIYDANGTFENCFEWWRGNASSPEVRSCLPFNQGRTDLLTGTISPSDIYNINLFATLLVHHEFRDASGCWAKLGEEFDDDVHALLSEHSLSALLTRPWVKHTVGDVGDNVFYEGLEELMLYAYVEATRVEEVGRHEGILRQMQEITEHYRNELIVRQGAPR